MHGNAKDESIKRSYEKSVKIKKNEYNDLLKEQTKEQEKLNKLLAEVGNALINESKFSLDVLNSSIDLCKKKLKDIATKIPLKIKSLNEEKAILTNLDNYYDEFMNWSNTFDEANNNEKKMIICKLIDRIELSRGYGIKMVLNTDYEQFISGE